MTRSAPSMSLRHLPPAPTTSWSAVPSGRRRTRAPRRRRSRKRSGRFFQQLLEQAPEVLVMREEDAEEQLLLPALHLDGGKVLHLGRVRILLDVHPAEFRLGKALGEREEAR